MMSDLKIYVIHYTKLDERREYINNLLSSLNIPFEFINEFDKEVLNEEIINTYYEKNKDKHYKKVSLWGENANDFKELSLSELSCSIKHLEALRKIGIDRFKYSLILEDDVIPTNEYFIDRIYNLIEKTSDWDVMFIGEGIGAKFKNKKIGYRRFLPLKKIFKMKHPATNCLEAYIIKKESINKINQDLIPINLVIDWELAFQFYKKQMKIYWSKENIFIQGSKNNIYNSELR